MAKKATAKKTSIPCRASILALIVHTIGTASRIRLAHPRAATVPGKGHPATNGVSAIQALQPTADPRRPPRFHDNPECVCFVIFFSEQYLFVAHLTVISGRHFVRKRTRVSLLLQEISQKTVRISGQQIRSCGEGEMRLIYGRSGERVGYRKANDHRHAESGRAAVSRAPPERWVRWGEWSGGCTTGYLLMSLRDGEQCDTDGDLLLSLRDGEQCDTDGDLLLSLRDGGVCGHGQELSFLPSRRGRLDSLLFCLGVFQRWLIASYGLHHALGDDEA